MLYSTALSLPGTLRRRFAHNLENYLFRPGGAYALAICRIGLFSYLYVHVYAGVLADGLADPDYYSKVNVATYRAKSVLYLLFPNDPPPIAFVHFVLMFAAISTLFAIAGVLTRVSMIVSVATLTFLASLTFAWEPLWSHPYNSGLLAGIGFMFARAGDVVSVDSYFARYVLRRAIAIDRRVYWWPVILGLFGTAALYFGGFYAKWSTTEWTYNFSWICSDNLRNAVALPWLMWGKTLPWQVDLIVNNPWLWKFAALGHVITQMLPMLAMFSFNKPYLRLAEGLVFVAGVALLKMVMGFWNPEWMILAVFFVDWEYFLKKFGVPLASTEPSRPVRNPGPIMAYAIVFIAINLVVIFTRYDDLGTSRLYPFSSMNFYSNVAASKPYSDHKFYPFSFEELELESSEGVHQKWYCYPGVGSLDASIAADASTQIKLPQQIGAILSVANAVNGIHAEKTADCEGAVNLKHYRAIDLYASILDIPAYPERVRFDVGFRALIGRYERDRNRVIAAASSLRTGPKLLIDVQSQGLDAARYEILLANDPWRNHPIGPLIAPRGVWTDQTFEIATEFYKALPVGWYPIVVRVTEKSGDIYDFFGGILYR
jgi:hypothetical protein